MTAVIERADLTALTDDQLAAAYFDEGADLDAIDAEHKRREQVRQARRQARRQRQGGWYEAAYQQFLNAEAATAGVLLNAKGISRSIEPFSLWSGSQWCVDAYASWELLRFWEAPGNARLTVTEYERQQRRERREERDYAMDRDEATGLRPDADEASRIQRDSISHVVSGPGRASEAQPERERASAHAGRSVPVRPGRVMTAPVRTADDIRASVAARQAPASRVVTAPEPALPAAYRGQVAVREESAVVTTRRAEVDGAETLDYARMFMGRFASFPSESALDVVTAWAAHAHLRDAEGRLAVRATPRLLLMSSEPGSGKSRVLELLGRLCPFTYGLDTEPTAAGLAHTLDKEHATALVDEADVLFGRGRRKEAVRAIINSGYTRNGTVLRMRGSKAERAKVFGPIALAGLDVMETATGDALSALLSRCIIVRMTRYGADLPDLAAEADRAALLIRNRLAMWAQEHVAALAAAEPELPEGIRGRAAQIWTPLVALADAAGGDWPERVRQACVDLVQHGGITAEEEDDTAAEIEDIFAGWGEQR